MVYLLKMVIFHGKRLNNQMVYGKKLRIYYVEEDEEKLVVDVMRLGSMKGTVKVRYYTDAWIEAETMPFGLCLSSPGTR